LGAPLEAAAVPSPRIPENDLEVCAPPGCAIDLPLAPGELKAATPLQSLLARWDMNRDPVRFWKTFGDEATLAWLSPSHLLFAFNAHPLIRRARASNFNTLRRVIRAVLLDANSRTVVRAVDWELTDTRRYLWPIDGNRILVHVGNELRIYGENLRLSAVFRSRVRFPLFASLRTKASWP